MAAQANLTLNTVVYVPGGILNALATWINRASGLAGSFSRVTQKVVAPAGNSKVYNVVHTLEIPIVQATDSACACAGTVLRTEKVSISYLTALTSTTADRTDTYLRLKDLVASAPFLDAMENLNPVS
jgi:hypothetical protein